MCHGFGSVFYISHALSTLNVVVTIKFVCDVMMNEVGEKGRGYVPDGVAGFAA